jgi:acetyl-CoA carboxylase biotin carboxylase subunit
VALECRINMEDPGRSFAPSPGRIESFVLPAGPFVRVDTHGYPGYRMPVLYDPLLAKVIVWAPTRDQAIARMERALAELRVAGPGVHTTTDFLRRVLADEEFRRGTHHTGLVSRLLAGASRRDDGAPRRAVPSTARTQPTPVGDKS